jgi:hypothetical protein
VEKKKKVHTVPNCLIIVKFLTYTHNLQMWPGAANTTWWAACWRSMSYVNSFTDSTVASNIHLLISTQPTQGYANAWDTHTHRDSNSFHIFKHQGNLLHFEGTLHNFCSTFHKMSFISVVFFLFK